MATVVGGRRGEGGFKREKRKSRLMSRPREDGLQAGTHAGEPPHFTEHRLGNAGVPPRLRVIRFGLTVEITGGGEISKVCKSHVVAREGECGFEELAGSRRHKSRVRFLTSRLNLNLQPFCVAQSQFSYMSCFRR